MRRTAVLTLAAALGAGVLSASAAQAETTALRSVMFVGNNWDGTATIVDAVTHEPLRTIDTIPDRDARMTEILTRAARPRRRHRRGGPGRAVLGTTSRSAGTPRSTSRGGRTATDH